LNSPPYNENKGVDLNRNFDAVWDFENYFNADAFFDMFNVVGPSGYIDGYPADIDHHTASGVINDTYRGTSAASEVETQYIQNLLSAHHNINYYLDIHSYDRSIFYSWGMEINQNMTEGVNDNIPTDNFLNTSLNSTQAPGVDITDRVGGTRDGVHRSTYKEYFPNNDTFPRLTLAVTKVISGQMRDLIIAQAGGASRSKLRSTYRNQQSTVLYATSGGSSDFAFKLMFTDPLRGPMYSFTMEVGHETEMAFHPDFVEDFPKIERETHLGIYGLLRMASAIGPIG
jgi:Zinc carboxypeptidase